MPKLFETTDINGMKLANRFIRSATWEGMAAPNGGCTPQLIDLMAQLAKGEVGLIITGYAYVMPEAKARIGQLGFYTDEFIGGLREMTRAVHDHGGKIVAQIAHAGIFCDPELTRRIPLAPSHIPDLIESEHAEMSLEEIHNISEAFGQAAQRAKAAGFDGVQIHAAHGYLHSQFLSPVFNRRSDVYGGTVENRARAVLEALKAIRDAVGPDFPVMIKMNCRDFIEGGLTLHQSLQIGEMLQNSGIDAIELSGGTLISGDLGPVRSKITSTKREAYFRQEAKKFKALLQVPLILVGGIRSVSVAQELLDEGCADYLSLCRPLVRQPNLVKRWAAGDTQKSTCISDSQCRQAAFSGDGIACVVDKKIRRTKDGG